MQFVHDMEIQYIVDRLTRNVYNWFMKKITALCRILTISLIASLIPLVAAAHEQWFATEQALQAPLPEFYSTWSGVRIAMVAAAVVMLGVSYLFHRFFAKLKIVHRIHGALARFAPLAPRFIQGAVGVLLIVNSEHGSFMAPDLSLNALPYPIAATLWVLQYAVGFSLVFGWFVRPIGALGILLYGAAFAFFPAKQLIGYFGFAGAFAYMLILGNPERASLCTTKSIKKIAAWFDAHKSYALSILRITFGLSLIGMGIAYKLSTPQITLAAIANVNVNFMQMVGFENFTNEMFVFCAGLAEVLFGILLTFNILPRIVSLKLFVLFSVTVLQFGVIELFGHMPIYAILFVLMTQQEKES